MKRLANWTLFLALLGGSIGLAPVASAAPTSGEGSPKTFNSLVGAESSDQGLQALAFLPNDITINEGDTITWSFPTHEPHTVTFVPPGQTPPSPFDPGTPNNSTFDNTQIVNSGLLLGGATYTITFGATGNFPFVCLLHARMSGTLHVNPVGSPRPEDNVNSLVNQGNLEGHQLLSDASTQKTLEERQVKNLPTAVTVGSGFVRSTAAGDQSVMIARYLPTNRTIHVGQTITWSATDPATPHTVTFGPAPADIVDPVNAPGFHGVLPTNPPGGTVSSGFIGQPFASQTFSVTFNAPGTYQYYCLLHAALGMTGSILVTQ